MGVAMTTHNAAIFQQAADIMRQEVTEALAFLGEQVVVKIRSRKAEESWIDHTGNLRSSIGYAVYEYGQRLIESAFAPVKGGTEGASEGRKLVETLAAKYAQTYTLVVVAGMQYADYVEALESKDVLASTEIWARKQVDVYVKRAVAKAMKRIETLQV